jgi:hypothetical protein
MALITSVTIPLAYVMMRNLLAAHYSWDDVGIWQGVSSISDAYLQFITASFSVYLLPTLSRLAKTGHHPRDREIAALRIASGGGREFLCLVAARRGYLAAVF